MAVEGIMPAFGKKSRVARVWLTALITLFAASPHVECRCPSGRIKPYCLSFLFRNPAHAGCCCAAEGSSSRGCCRVPDAPSPTQALPPCCARFHGGQAGEAEVIGIDAPCCTKTVMDSADFLPPSSGSGPAEAPGCVVDLPSLDDPFLFLSADRSLLAWQTHFLAPPPTDLVTVLQRLTI